MRASRERRGWVLERTGDDLGALEVFVGMEVAWRQGEPQSDQDKKEVRSPPHGNFKLYLARCDSGRRPQNSSIRLKCAHPGRVVEGITGRGSREKKNVGAQGKCRMTVCCDHQHKGEKKALREKKKERRGYDP